VQFSEVYPLIIELRYSNRLIKINFHATQWKDESLVDMSPRLLTDNYHIQFVFNFDGIDYTKLNVGERLTPDIISIDLIDKNDVNNFLLLTIARGDNASHPIIYVPPELYNEGHAFLTRESGDVWILDVDA